ncbi:MAG: cytochrome c oxidase subunit 3 [Cellvibrionaceae bacterium]|nr:cytochrome c oxidase subunit 3 [Cellvibrionaceae bacterium]
MSSESNYYVPEQSRLPIFASLGMFLMAVGLASWLNGNGASIFMLGSVVMACVLWCWFSIVISENMAGKNSAQLKRSYVWGMGWFIFSEVMFFAAFFGALFYMRQIALPELGGDNTTNQILWSGFQNVWPLMITPDMAVNGAAAKVFGPDINMSISTAESIWTWLPFWNTTVLLTSSVTVHFAHTALKNDNRKNFNFWLGFTVALGIIFLILQIEEYRHAYHQGLMIDSGAYGTTFFMLTGFHGAHVTLGTFMLLVMWLRSMSKGHFNHRDSFGFDAASWYWHFVDVVWLGLFIFVYILG